MPAPPSRKSWVWHIAQTCAEHCTALGSELEDMDIQVESGSDVLSVAVRDRTCSGKYTVAGGVLPGDDPEALKQEIHMAIGTELSRLRAL